MEEEMEEAAANHNLQPRQFSHHMGPLPVDAESLRGQIFQAANAATIRRY